MVNVHKFGGTCTDSFQNLLRIIEILQSQDYPTVVVLSAANGVTDLIKHVLSSDIDSKLLNNITERLKERHKELLAKPDLSKNLIDEFERFQRLISGIQYTETVSEAVYDLVMSFGERFISLVLELLLSERNISAKVHNPEEFIVTNGKFRVADILLEASSSNIEQILIPQLEEYQIHIIPGFFGKSVDGQVNLIGRSGSDYTATAIGNCLKADSITIWKDVFGLMSADPTIIPSAKSIKHVTFTEAAELAYFGAKLLHPKAAGPARASNIPLYIRHFNNEKLYTLIQDSQTEQEGSIKSISNITDLSLVRIYSQPGEHSRNLLEKALVAISQIEPPISLSISQTNAVFLINRSRNNEVLNKFTHMSSEISKTELEDNLALLAIVGEGIMDNSKLISSIIELLSSSNIETKMISAGASLATFNVVIDQNDFQKSMELVHQHIFGV